MTALRILIHGVDFDPRSTGIPKYTAEMAIWLAGRGHHVEAVAGFPYYPEWRIDPDYVDKRFHEEICEGVRVIRVPLTLSPDGTLTAGKRVRLEASFTRNGARYWAPVLRRPARHDVVIAICPSLQAGIYPLVYRALRSVPWIFHVQDLQVDAALRLGMVRGFGRVLYGVENFLLRSATRVSTITEAMRRRIIEKGVPEGRTWLFPNWSDVDRIRPQPRDNAFRRRHGLTGDEFLVMCAGAMGEKHGLDLVLAAADRLRDEPGLRFMLVGDGSARAGLVRRAEELRLPNLSFLPLQPVEVVPEMLAAADVQCVIQKRDAADLVMPSKLTNILAAGRPALVTAAPETALHDVVVGSDAGWVCAPEDEREFAELIRRGMAERPALERMGINARTYAEQRLDKHRVLGDFESRVCEWVRQNRCS